MSQIRQRPSGQNREISTGRSSVRFLPLTHLVALCVAYGIVYENNVHRCFTPRERNNLKSTNKENFSISHMIPRSACTEHF